MSRCQDFTKRCQKCGRIKSTTRRRVIYDKSYVGPCADSFCYASCDLPACRPYHASVCDACVPKLGREERP